VEALNLGGLSSGTQQIGRKTIAKMDIILNNLNFLSQSMIPKLDEDLVEREAKTRDTILTAFEIVEKRVTQANEQVHRYKLGGMNDDRFIKKYNQMLCGSLFYFYWNYADVPTPAVVSSITDLAISVKELMNSALVARQNFPGSAKRATSANLKLLSEVSTKLFRLGDPKLGFRLSNANKHVSGLLRQICFDAAKGPSSSQETLTSQVKNIAEFLKILKESLKNPTYSLRGPLQPVKEESEMYKAARVLIEESVQWYEGRGGGRGGDRDLVASVRTLSANIADLADAAPETDRTGIYNASMAISTTVAEIFALFLPEATLADDVDLKDLILLALKSALHFSNIILIGASCLVTRNENVHRQQLAMAVRSLAYAGASLIDSLALMR